MAQTNEPARMSLAQLAAGKVAGAAKELGQVAMSPVALAVGVARAVPELPGMIGDKVKDNHVQQPSFTGQLASLGREALKDTNNTMHEVMFGKQVGQNELGTPLSPTQMDVNKGLGNHGTMSMDDLRNYAANRTTEASRQMEQPSQQQERGRSM
jgi:hypothetical protein